MVTHCVLFVMELTNEEGRVRWRNAVSGRGMDAPDGRNLTDAFTGFLPGESFLIMDRDSSFHEAFGACLNKQALGQCGFHRVHRIAVLISSASTVRLNERSPTG